MDRMGAALLWVSGIIIAMVLTLIVVGNDRGASTEVGLLEGTSVATPAQCDALYHAIWKVQSEKSHYTLIQIAESLDCPFDE